MRLQSANLKHRKPLQAKKLAAGGCRRSSAAQSDIFIAIVRDPQEDHPLEVISSVLHLDCEKGSAQKFEVPLLMLPPHHNDARKPASNEVQASQQPDRQQKLGALQESQKILSSFGANNVRANLKGANAAQLI